MSATTERSGPTERPVRVLALGGSMREGSWSAVALKSALKIAAAMGAETQLCDVRTLALPLYDPDVPLEAHPAYDDTEEAAQPASVHSFLAELRAADALLLCSPTYHGTISGAVKNALDYVEFMAGDTPRYLGGRVAGLIGLGGAGAMNAINALYHTARTLNLLTVGTPIIVTRDMLNPDTLDIADERTRTRLTATVREVIELAALTRARREIAAR